MELLVPGERMVQRDACDVELYRSTWGSILRVDEFREFAYSGSMESRHGNTMLRVCSAVKSVLQQCPDSRSGARLNRTRSERIRDSDVYAPCRAPLHPEAHTTVSPSGVARLLETDIRRRSGTGPNPATQSMRAEKLGVWPSAYHGDMNGEAPATAQTIHGNETCRFKDSRVEILSCFYV